MKSHYASKKTMAARMRADAFNAAHPVGTRVRWWTTHRDAAVDGVTEAWACVERKEAVVQIAGVRDPVPLSHVAVEVRGTPVVKTLARDYDARRDRVLPPEGPRFVDDDGTVWDVTARERR
jgi:hypothetical protein